MYIYIHVCNIYICIYTVLDKNNLRGPRTFPAWVYKESCVITKNARD